MPLESAGVVPDEPAIATERTAGLMTERHRITASLAGFTLIGVALAGAAQASADLDPSPTPTPPYLPAPPPAERSAMTPNQPGVPVADPAAPPPVPANFQPSVPEIQNPVYGSGKYGGGVLGTLKDLWHQAQNPYYAPEEVMGSGGGAPAPPPGAGPAPALPPGYVSTNAPGSETPATSTGGGGPATGRPALPPGYYSLSGPPPPGYEFVSPQAPTTAVPAPSP